VNLRDLQYVVAVAELQHFGRAAERCHVSQPTLSMQIRKVEDYLSVELFERSGRRVLVTPAGEQIVERARVLLRDYEELRLTAKRLKDPSAGQYKLGAFPTLAPYLLPRIVPVIHESFPSLRLLLVEDKTEQLLLKLRRGQLDLALLALPVPGDDLECCPLFDEAFLLATSAAHPLATRSSVSVDSLGEYPLLLLDEGHCLRDQALEFCKLNALEESGDFRATSLPTLMQMVSTDLGITLVPEMATRDAPRGLHFIPFDPPAPHRSIGLVWRRGAGQPAFFTAIADLIRATRNSA
jgi:LysR family hydrogen peroxide-inducible transcriptional activator